MASEEKLESIYVDLDTILDTRLGTICLYDPAMATKVVTSGKYHSRDEDLFDGLSKEKFKELYSKRTKEVLFKSTVTNVVLFLKQLIDTFARQAINRPYHDGCKIIINCYPYLLDEHDTAAIRNALDCWFKQIVPIEFVNLNNQLLTPSYCKSNFAMMIRYEYEDWFNTHSKAFETCILPEVNMYVPALYFNKKPNDDELEKAIKTAKHPMRAIEILASPIINLRLMDAELFSIISLTK